MEQKQTGRMIRPASTYIGPIPVDAAPVDAAPADTDPAE